MIWQHRLTCVGQLAVVVFGASDLIFDLCFEQLHIIWFCDLTSIPDFRDVICALACRCTHMQFNLAFCFNDAALRNMLVVLESYGQNCKLKQKTKLRRMLAKMLSPCHQRPRQTSRFVLCHVFMKRRVLLRCFCCGVWRLCFERPHC